MVGRIYHVGLTVSDLDKSIAFYRDVLGLKFQGEIMMVGEEWIYVNTLDTKS